MKLALPRGHSLIRLAVNVVFLCALGLAAQVARDGKLSVRIIDAATGQPTP